MTRLSAFRLLLLLLLCGMILAVSCRKRDKFDSDPSLRLAFSEDTVFFDTVFTSIGSVTKRLTVYNDNDGKLLVSEIRLAGGEASNYRINIDGLPTLSATNVEIPGHDSIFIFIRVTVDPDDINTPFVVADSIRFLTNGQPQNVKLMAWGQNARFLKDTVIGENQVWDSLRPYVIFGSARVDTGVRLTLSPGTKVYLHWNAYFAVSEEASLELLGELNHPVTFQGDRLDAFYRDLPGQWGGIYLERGSREHVIRYAVIKNGRFGLSLDSIGTASVPGLLLDNTIIRNTTADGIYAYASSIRSVNCVIGNNGGASLEVEKGGSYDFRHLTIANYWAGSVRQYPALYLSNYAYDSLGNKITHPLEKAYFGNVLVYGSNEDELLLDADAGALFEYQFDHAILKTPGPVSDPAHFINCIANEDPLFVDPATDDFHIDSLSPAIGKGVFLDVPYDLDGTIRPLNPALGAYEFVPGK